MGLIKKFVFATTLLVSMNALADTRKFTFTAVEVDGTKFWLPSYVAVKKGDTVKLHLISKVPGAGSVHGFEIKDYKISEVVDDKGKDIEFVADKAGTFDIGCQLHPAHIGAQIHVE